MNRSRRGMESTVKIRPLSAEGGAIQAEGCRPKAEGIPQRNTVSTAYSLQSTVFSLIREYKGQVFEVLVLPKWFEYQGEIFRSLSAVAKVITGMRWNGYHFFRLKAVDRRLKATSAKSESTH